MKTYDKAGAIAAFYYLMAVDGNVSADEWEKLDEIGTELDKELYPLYKEELIAKCNDQLENGIGEGTLLDAAMAGLDMALAQWGSEPEQELKEARKNIRKGLEEEEIDCGVSSRAILWDMITIAVGGKEYGPAERSLIEHYAAISEIEGSVLQEMEQLAKSYIAVEEEIKWLEAANKNQLTIETLEKRLQVIVGCAESLILDEALDEEIEAIIIKEDFIDITRKKRRELSAPVVAKVKEVVTPVAEKVSEAVAPVIAKASEAVAPVTEKISEAVNPVVEKVSAAVTPTVKKAGEGIAKMPEKVGEEISKAGKELSRAGEKTGKELSKASTKAGEAMAPVKEKVLKVTAPAIFGIGCTAGKLMSSTKGMFKKSVDSRRKGK